MRRWCIRHPEAELVALCDIRSKPKRAWHRLNVPLFQDMGRTMLEQVPGIWMW
jgi:hypothetical protein